MVGEFVKDVVTSYQRVFPFAEVCARILSLGGIDRRITSPFHLSLLLDDEALVNTQAVHTFLKVDGLFLSLTCDFELSFFYDVNVVSFFSLAINHLVASVLFEHKRVHHSLNLSFGPMVQKG